MKTFRECFSQLNKHKDFDPNAFLCDAKVSQNLCDFMLALSLAHNDLKYHIMCHELLVSSKPEGIPKRNPIWGEYNGIQLYIVRLHVSFVQEFFKLIEDNKKVLNEAFFLDVLNNLNKTVRTHWAHIVEAAIDSTNTKNKKKNPFLMIRNKVGFHYDAKEIRTGYQVGFFDKNIPLQEACISLGDRMCQARFYYADRAVEGYLKKRIGEDPACFYDLLITILKQANIALYNLCKMFIQKRGYGWREPKE